MLLEAAVSLFFHSRAVFSGVFYGNIWQSRSFPFLSQELFYANGSVYDQLLILNDNLEVDPVLLEEQGLPFYAGTWVTQLLVTNLGMAATFTHILLWNRDDLKSAWSWCSPSSIRKMWQGFGIESLKIWKQGAPEDRQEEFADDKDLDPHYREMLKYADAPNSWYIVTLLFSVVVALVVIYKTNSTLSWWGFLLGVTLASLCILFFGTLYAITGLSFSIQTFVQMIGGFIHPGKPMANMYFVLFSHSECYFICQCPVGSHTSNRLGESGTFIAS